VSEHKFKDNRTLINSIYFGLLRALYSEADSKTSDISKTLAKSVARGVEVRTTADQKANLAKGAKRLREKLE